MLEFCQEMKIPVNTSAVLSYIKAIEPTEIPLYKLISFLEYVKDVCRIPSPKILLHEVLERFSEGKESCLRIGFYKLCSFLCSIKSWEVDNCYLQNFLKCCIRNDCWTQLADFFKAWNKDARLISLCQMLTFEFKSVGLFFEKLTEEMYKLSELPSGSISKLGQLGVSLMLEFFSQEKYQYAFEILRVLHKYNINYIKLQEPLYKLPYLNILLEKKDFFFFPFKVASIAMDICLHLKRPKDAYQIYQSFPFSIPEELDEKLKVEIKCQLFGSLLKLAEHLCFIEPLGLGLVVFCDLMLRTKGFETEKFKDFIGKIQDIYNKYLTIVLNEQQLSVALEFYKYYQSWEGETFAIEPQVLRGLIVFFAEKDMADIANELFALGCIRQIYNIEEPQTDKFSWHLIILSSWTNFEVKSAIDKFFENLAPALSSKSNIGFDIWCTVKITFQESENDNFEINCLKESRHTIVSAKKIACNALKTLDSDIAWIEYANPHCLDIDPKTIYNYCLKKCKRIEVVQISVENTPTNVKQKVEDKLYSSFDNCDNEFIEECISLKSLRNLTNQLTPENPVIDNSHQSTLFETDSSPVYNISESCHQMTSEKMILESIKQEEISSNTNEMIFKKENISDSSNESTLKQEEISNNTNELIFKKENISDNSNESTLKQEEILNIIDESSFNDKCTILNSEVTSETISEDTSNRILDQINFKVSSLLIPENISTNVQRPVPNKSSQIKVRKRFYQATSNKWKKRISKQINLKTFNIGRKVSDVVTSRKFYSKKSKKIQSKIAKKKKQLLNAVESISELPHSDSKESNKINQEASTRTVKNIQTTDTNFSQNADSKIKSLISKIKPIQLNKSKSLMLTSYIYHPVLQDLLSAHYTPHPALKGFFT
ncbi:uncharacterized protein CDAR_176521 [Caerostris darwini]|uniref:Uncharacterized protein n=1 Tax=Caerostris darwini TaxID=1538125 RepID=A0AAV4QAE6_9ARAC|nr:uncharacterized protein CDAR_176521 [Caerostris darwini]